jgi:hypothetical protein
MKPSQRYRKPSICPAGCMASARSATCTKNAPIHRRAILEDLHFSYQLAIVHAGLGKKEKAVDDLERAYAKRSLPAPFLRFDPRLNNLRAEPSFQDFARLIGLFFQALLCQSRQNCINQLQTDSAPHAPSRICYEP